MMKDLLSILPLSFRKEVAPILNSENVEELRLRCGQPLHYVNHLGEFPFSSQVTHSDLDFVLARACEYSLHAVQEQINRGFLTMSGGHRIGICGSAVMEQGDIKTLRPVSSLSIRIAKEYPDISSTIIPQIKKNHLIYNTLILSPPSLGKTTLLRDLIRNLSNGKGITPQRVGVVDERCEIAALHHAQPLFDVGSRTDVLENCPKALGLLFLLRSMNPQILAVDEITTPQDVDAMTHVWGCGVSLLATIHGESKQELMTRPLFQKWKALHLFQKIITIEKRKGTRFYTVEDLPC